MDHFIWASGATSGDYCLAGVQGISVLFKTLVIMADNSKIQWTDATWNPWHGCKKVSPGCKYCYMYRDKEMHKQDPTVVVRGKTTFNAPLKWKDPRIIFTCSWSDWFIDEADLWRPEAWRIIKATPWHTYQILTKRALTSQYIKDRLPDDWGEGYPNVWLGVSVESQEEVDRISVLEEIPAKVKFISFEPLIGPITKNFVGEVDWIIIGGESGNETGKYRYRPCELKWIEAIIDHYRDPELGGAAIFVKQLGTYLAKIHEFDDRHGGDMEEWPEHIRIREFPV